MNRRRCLVGLLGLLALDACAKIEGPTDPVWGKEPCAHCKMLVSDQRYAAQAAESQDRFYFDDIGCLVSWMKTRQASHLWVRDASSARWLDAKTARYHDGASTPMDFGFEARAEGGVSWEEMLGQLAAKKKGAP